MAINNRTAFRRVSLPLASLASAFAILSALPAHATDTSTSPGLGIVGTGSPAQTFGIVGTGSPSQTFGIVGTGSPAQTFGIVGTGSPAQTFGIVGTGSPAQTFGIVGTGSPAQTFGIVGTGSPAQTFGIVGTGSPAQARGIVGTGSPAQTFGIVGTGSPAQARGIVGTGSPARTFGIVGTGSPAQTFGIVGTGSPAQARGIVGTGSPAETFGIVGTGTLGIVGTGVFGIVGTGNPVASFETLSDRFGTSEDLVTFGPVEQVADGKLVTLGQEVVVEDVALLAQVSVGDTVAIFGKQTPKELSASRILKIEGGFVDGSTPIYVAGFATSNMKDDGTFSIGELKVQIGSAGSDASAYEISAGTYVRVAGRKFGDFVVADGVAK